MEEHPDKLQLKKQLRSRMHELREDIPPDRRTEVSRKACEHAIQEMNRLRSELGQRKLILFLYMTFRSEADTSILLAEALAQGDIVLIPKVRGDSPLMELREIKKREDVEPGRWNIPEPAEHTSVYPVEKWLEIDLVIVPGLAYDLHGGRIGYGGGYYDRFAELIDIEIQRQVKQGQVATPPIYAGLVLPGQLLQPHEIPMESQDFRLNLLFTESGVLHIE
ncbi:5-formyltetrahydrofolate cyclo-ligase [Paenibacillus sp. Marseille-Q4541]|uniref:5-formyltetrahydrofolate cyclo-ligase n=1 Tax=Paenibacillus sp. Marseille-Q4541 TaxID=2831522 RepID=UPI001BA6555B|nr:5-formyltetrahydrofolate cyclo-ligase [Paenibacillus sp. Marseille-Q4541]